MIHHLISCNIFNHLQIKYNQIVISLYLNQGKLTIYMYLNDKPGHFFFTFSKVSLVILHTELSIFSPVFTKYQLLIIKS
jgi:hypothetical protein